MKIVLRIAVDDETTYGVIADEFLKLVAKKRDVTPHKDEKLKATFFDPTSNTNNVIRSKANVYEALTYDQLPEYSSTKSADEMFKELEKESKPAAKKGGYTTI